MSEQERMRGRAIHFPKGSQPNMELSRRKHREARKQQMCSNFKKEGSLHQTKNWELHRNRQVLEGSAAGEGFREINQRWNKYSPLSLSHSPCGFLSILNQVFIGSRQAGYHSCLMKDSQKESLNIMSET